MIVRIQVIKVYDVDTGGGDTTDPQSVQAAIEQVENMQSAEIEKVGHFVDVTTDYAEVVGPDDPDADVFDHKVDAAVDQLMEGGARLGRT